MRQGLDRDYLINEMEKIVDLLIMKNTDYGNSFDQMMDKFGGLSFIIRLHDKIGRIDTIFQRQQRLVESESVLDTVDDIIGYCLLYKHYMEKNAVKKWNDWVFG